MANTRATLTPESAQFKTSTFPALKQSSDASGSRRYLAYDASLDEAAYWTFIAPQGLSGSMSVLIYYAMTSATSGNTIWDAAVEAITSGDAVDTDSSESFDSVNVSASSTVPGAAGYMKFVEIAIANADSIAAGDLVRVQIRRIGSSGSDTASGDANLFAVEFRDAV